MKLIKLNCLLSISSRRKIKLQLNKCKAAIKQMQRSAFELVFNVSHSKSIYRSLFSLLEDTTFSNLWADSKALLKSNFSTRNIVLINL